MFEPRLFYTFLWHRPNIAKRPSNDHQTSKNIQKPRGPLPCSQYMLLCCSCLTKVHSCTAVPVAHGASVTSLQKNICTRFILRCNFLWVACVVSFIICPSSGFFLIFLANSWICERCDPLEELCVPCVHVGFGDRTVVSVAGVYLAISTWDSQKLEPSCQRKTMGRSDILWHKSSVNS